MNFEIPSDITAYLESPHRRALHEVLVSELNGGDIHGDSDRRQAVLLSRKAS